MKACKRLALFFVALSSLAEAASTETEDHAKDLGEIKIAISLIWEGEHILLHNLQALQELRRSQPNIPFLQFLNPAYYTKPNADRRLISEQINSTLTQNDTLGLHLHGWKSMVSAAGIDFRDQPTYWGNTITAADCQPDCGHEVPLTAYSSGELSRLFQFGIGLFKKEGFGKLSIFMAGGWMASYDLLATAAAHGFSYDGSGIPKRMVKPQLQHYPLYEWISNLWPEGEGFTQPHDFSTHLGRIQEIGLSAGTFEYRSSNDMLHQFEQLAAQWKKNPQETFVFNMGIYQEKARDQVPHLRKALGQIERLAKSQKIPLRYLALPKPEEANFTYQANSPRGFPMRRERRTFL